jgi:hypothetical protein
MAIGAIDSLDTVRGLGREIRASYTPDAERTAAYADRLDRFAQVSALNETRRG